MSSLISSRPDATEYAHSYGPYVDLVPETEVLAAMAGELDATLSCLRQVSEEVALIRHAPYTWSVKQVLGHLIDSERIFAERAVPFARRDPAELPGFEENDFVRNAGFDDFPLSELVEEFEHLSALSSLALPASEPDAWGRSGVANGHRVTVRALAYIIVGPRAPSHAHRPQAPGGRLASWPILRHARTTAEWQHQRFMVVIVKQH